jgi:hypothetical protein
MGIAKRDLCQPSGRTDVRTTATFPTLADYNRSSTKAVANGALAWHVDTSVATRVNRYHYGIEVHVPYNPRDKEHEGRQAWADKDGSLRVHYNWSSVLPKVSLGRHACKCDYAQLMVPAYAGR